MSFLRLMKALARRAQPPQDIEGVFAFHRDLRAHAVQFGVVAYAFDGLG